LRSAFVAVVMLTLLTLFASIGAYSGQIEAEPLYKVSAGGFRLWVELPMPGQSSSAKEQHG
jgi:hypothetical protein